MSLMACSSQDQERAKADARQASAKVQKGVKELGRNVDAAVKPDQEKASDKVSAGTDQVKEAMSKAGVKLDHAALLAKVKAKLASDAGLSTLTKVDVSVDGTEVTLSGSVSSEEQKKVVEKAASQVDGITRVNNALVIAP